MFFDPNYLERFNNKIPEGYVEVKMLPKLTVEDLTPQEVTQTIVFMANADERKSALSILKALERNTPDDYLGAALVSIIVNGAEVRATVNDGKESPEEVIARLTGKGYSIGQICMACMQIAADQTKSLAESLKQPKQLDVEFQFVDKTDEALNITAALRPWMELFLNDSKDLPDMKGFIFDVEQQKLTPLADYFAKRSEFDSLTGFERSFRAYALSGAMNSADQLRFAPPETKPDDASTSGSYPFRKAHLKEYLAQGKTLNFAELFPGSEPLNGSELVDLVKKAMLTVTPFTPHPQIMDILNIPIGEYRPHCICGKCK